MERTKGKDQYLILTNDPSITAWGWTLLNGKGRVVKIGCIKTESDVKRLRIRKGDDTVRRVSEINQRILEIVEHYKVNFLLSELPHGSQNAQAAVAIGLVTAIVQTISDCTGIPVEWYSEGDSKKAVLNKRSATKAEMIKAIDKLYDVPWTRTKYIDEAVADSLAVHYVATKQSSMLKMMKR